jgi:hypothetical protein
MGEFGGNVATKTLSCSFCGKDNDRVRKLLAGGCGGSIRDESMRACVRIFSRDGAGVVTVVRRPATEICVLAQNARRGSAFVEVWK